MCGVAASGKSTKALELAKRYDAIIISTDAIREELFGDPMRQDKNGEVFKTAFKRIKEGLVKNQNVIFDATNVNRADRKNVLMRAKLFGKGYNVCYYATTSLEEAKKRNAERDRHVPENIIEKQFKRFTVPTTDEGWDAVYEF